MKFGFSHLRAILFTVLLLGLNLLAHASGAIGVVEVGDLPVEAQTTLALIKQGGPFPYPKDGVTFGNYQRALPAQPRGYYHEFTVKTPGVRSRGAQRIVVGGHQPPEYFYTSDHYVTFKRIHE